MRTLSLTIAVALACLSWRIAGAVSFDSPNRGVGTRLLSCPPAPDPCTALEGFGTNQEPGPWDVDGVVAVPGNFSNAIGFQHSTIVAGHAEGTGGISLALVDSFTASSAGSLLTSSFTLDAPAILSITADLSLTQNAAALALSSITISGFVQVTRASETIFSEGLAADGLDHGSRTIHFEQLLAPGTYSFTIGAGGSQTTVSADALSTATWSASADLTSVPEPAGLALAALALALTRRFGGAGRRSRPV